MAHNIDTTTGTPAIAYVGETPWHELGEQLEEGQPIETWLKAAQLEWHLDRLPVQYLVKGKLRTVAERYVLVRSDTGDALSIVSGGYNIFQPKDTLEFYRDLIYDFGYTLETAGALDGGRKVWALAKTGKIDAVDDRGDDQLAAYLLLASSCDKTLATTVAFTSVRVVCQNTLHFAVEDIEAQNRPQVKVPHNFAFDPETIKGKLGLLSTSWSEFISAARKMTDFRFGDEDASAYFEYLLRQKDKTTLSARAKREHEALLAIFRSAPGQELQTASGTLWGAVNAVTYYADHVRSGSGGERLDSAWFGPGSLLKDKAWHFASGIVSPRPFSLNL